MILEHRYNKHLVVRVNPEPAKAFLHRMNQTQTAEGLKIKIVKRLAITGGWWNPDDNQLTINIHPLLLLFSSKKKRVKKFIGRVIAHELAHAGKGENGGYTLKDLIKLLGLWVLFSVSLAVLVEARFFLVPPLYRVAYDFLLSATSFYWACAIAYWTSEEEKMARRIGAILTNVLEKNDVVEVIEV